MALMRRFMVIGLAGCAFSLGCSDSNDKNPTQQDQGGITPGKDGGTASDGKRTDGSNPITPPCNCQFGEVCDASGNCIKPNAGEAWGEFVLLHLINPGMNDILADSAKAEGQLKNQEDLPADYRTKIPVSEGETCWLEFGTMYPYNNGVGKPYWPSKPGLGAGNLTFKVSGGQGDIVLVAADYGKGSSDWSYSHEDVPPALKEQSAVYGDFFESKYIPDGASFQVQATGGPDVAAQAFSGGEIPKSFSITNPKANEAGARAPAGQDLKVTWSPAQPSAVMEIALVQGEPDFMTLLTCKVKDDGEVLLPKDAVANFLGTVYLTMTRNIVRTTKAKTKDNRSIYLTLIGRNEHHGQFDLVSE
jgi:hypothetical protein